MGRTARTGVPAAAGREAQVTPAKVCCQPGREELRGPLALKDVKAAEHDRPSHLSLRQHIEQRLGRRFRGRRVLTGDEKTIGHHIRLPICSLRVMPPCSWLCRNKPPMAWEGRDASRGSKGQRAELPGGRRGSSFGAIKLPFTDHVRGLDAGNEDACAAERLEPKHGPSDALDGPVVLLDDVVEVLALTQFDGRAGVGIDALDGSGVGAALVNGDLLGHTVQIDGSLQKLPGRSAVSLGTQQKVDRVAVTIDRPVQVLPLASDVRPAMYAQRWTVA
jgi:hypothetical protein